MKKTIEGWVNPEEITHYEQAKDAYVLCVVNESKGKQTCAVTLTTNLERRKELSESEVRALIFKFKNYFFEDAETYAQEFINKLFETHTQEGK